MTARIILIKQSIVPIFFVLQNFPFAFIVPPVIGFDKSSWNREILSTEGFIKWIARAVPRGPAGWSLR